MHSSFEKPDNFKKILTTLLKFATKREVATRLRVSISSIARYSKGKNIPYILDRHRFADSMTLMLLEKLENLPDSYNGNTTVS